MEQRLNRQNEQWERIKNLLAGRPIIEASPQNLAVIAPVGQHIPATLARVTLAAWQADLIQQRHEVARVGLFAGGQHDGQREAMAVAGEVYFGGQSASAAAETVVLRFLRTPFFPAPLAARVARIDVESTIQVSRSIKPS